MTASADATANAKSPPTAPPPPPSPPSTRTPEPADRLSTRATLRRCILWVVIAYVAGTTSFILGLTANQASPTAMLLGILLYGCFIGLLMVFTGLTLMNVRRTNLIPLRDPRLSESINFENF